MDTHVPGRHVRIIVDYRDMVQRYAQFLGNNQVDHRVDTLANFRGPGDYRDPGVIVQFQNRAAAIGFMNLGAAGIVDGGGQANAFLEAILRYPT